MSKTMNTIFISYRREDSAGYAGRIFDRLRDSFGGERVFMDVSAIEPGVDFVEAIDQAVGSCTVLIVVIGRKWHTCTDAAGKRRLDDPNDFIRLETATALRRNIRVIPVLVQDAVMPREEELPDDLKKLARRQAIEVDDTHWDLDMGQLLEILRGLLADEVPTGEEKSTPAKGTGTGKPPSPPSPRRKRWVIPSVTAAVIALAALLYSVISPPPSPPPSPPAEIKPDPAIATVPELKGRPLDDAVQLLRKAGFEAGKIVRRTSADAMPDTVVSQSPEAGVKLGRGARVLLVVAAKPASPAPVAVWVPDLRKLSVTEAVTVLEKAGLQPGMMTTREKKKVSSGTVIDQKPRSGTEVRPGTKVDLLIEAPAGRLVLGDEEPPPATQRHMVIARGNLDLREDFAVDLDTGKVKSTGEWGRVGTTADRDDLRYHVKAGRARYLYLHNGATAGIIREKGDYERCSQAGMTNKAIPLDTLPAKVTICVRTDSGHLATVVLREPPGTTAGILKISYITWK